MTFLENCMDENSICSSHSNLSIDSFDVEFCVPGVSISRTLQLKKCRNRSITFSKSKYTAIVWLFFPVASIRCVIRWKKAVSVDLFFRKPNRCVSPTLSLVSGTEYGQNSGKQAQMFLLVVSTDDVSFKNFHWNYHNWEKRIKQQKYLGMENSNSRVWLGKSPVV